MTPEQTKLVEDNLGLVHDIIQKRFSRTGLEYDDLVQQGAIGLMLAAQAYDPSKGMFSTLAYTSIVHELRQLLRRESRAKVVPRNATYSLDKIINPTTLETYGSTIADSARPVERRIDDRDMVSRAMQAIPSLSERAQTVMRLYIAGNERVDIAKMFGVSRQAISQVVRRSQRVLRQAAGRS